MDGWVSVRNTGAAIPAVELIESLIKKLKGFYNVDSNRFRIIGQGVIGAEIASYIAAESQDPDIDFISMHRFGLSSPSIETVHIIDHKIFMQIIKMDLQQIDLILRLLHL